MPSPGAGGSHFLGVSGAARGGTSFSHPPLGAGAGASPGTACVSWPKAGGLRKCMVPNLPSEKSKYVGNLAKGKCNPLGNV